MAVKLSIQAMSDQRFLFEKCQQWKKQIFNVTILLQFQNIIPFTKLKKRIFESKKILCLISWCVFERKKIRKMKEKIQNFDIKLIFTMVIFEISKKCENVSEKKDHYVK